MKPQIFYNGLPIASVDPTILALDHGLTFGDAVCELLPAFYGRPLLLEEHCKRLVQSAEMVGFSGSVPVADIQRCVLERLSESPSPKASIRIYVSAGTGAGQVRGTQLNWMVTLSNPPEIPNEHLLKGKKLATRLQRTTARGAQAKVTNYQEALQAVAQAKAQGFDDVLWLNSDREVTEASMANIFFIERDQELLRLVTPHTESGLLAGLTRKTIVDLCTSAKILVEVRGVLEEELPRFDEAFVTSSVSGIIPVAQIGAHRLHSRRSKAHLPYIESLFGTWVHQQLGFAVHWATGTRLDTIAPENRNLQ